MEYILPSSLKWFLYLCLVAIAAFTVYHLSTQTQSYWLILSALFLSLITLGNTFLERALSIAITGVLITIVVFVAGIAAWSTPAVAVFLMLTTLFSFYLVEKNSANFYMGFIIALFAILSGSMPLGFGENLDRGFFILYGTAIAIFFQLIFLYKFTQNEIRSCIITTVQQLIFLNKEIFDCFLQKDYKDNLYLYERRFHLQKNKYLGAITKLRELVKVTTTHERENLTKQIKDLEALYEIMMEYSMLRWRVSDHTIFSLADTELANIEKEINLLFNKQIKKIKNNKLQITVDDLSQAIKQFEGLFQNVIQVTAKEPLVFLLFIASLKTFRDKIKVIMDASEIS